MVSSKKGQGATEYLVILAVVLIVALVVIALLGFFPGVGGAAMESQSASFWSGAQPFSITSFKISNVSVDMVMHNRLSEKLTLTAIAFDGTPLSNVTNTTFKGGEERLVTGTLDATCGAAGDGFEYEVELTYNQGGIAGKKVFGDKPLVGKCT